MWDLSACRFLLAANSGEGSGKHLTNFCKGPTNWNSAAFAGYDPPDAVAEAAGAGEMLCEVSVWWPEQFSASR